MYRFPAGSRHERKRRVADPVLSEAKVVHCEFKFGNGMAFFKMLFGDGDTLVKFIDSASPPTDPAGERRRENRLSAGSGRVVTAHRSQRIAQYSPYLPLTESSSFFES
jgi:hypothetical protein